MEQSNELIKEIREAYAKEEGYKSFASMASNVNIVPRDISEIAKRYATGINADLQAKCERYEAALRFIWEWQLPVTGRFWNDEDKTPMSYEACYGSNGARDFMRNIANEALSGEGEKEGMDDE